MDDRECRARLALNRIPGIGPSLYVHLLELFGSAAGVFESSAVRLSAIKQLEQPQRHAILAGVDASGVKKDLDWLDGDGCAVRFLGQADYPGQLAEIARPPPVLFLQGRHELLAATQLAVVGSRNPTHAGLLNSAAFARFLSRAGISVTSGLASGIDAAAHQAALAECGSTIAVAATGIDVVYPAVNRDLARQIRDSGLLVSTFPAGHGPKRSHFPQRNRIISGLGLGVLVVEAARRSGSLITARHAVEQGREVFAIPGSIHSPLSRGCHWLIRQGAKLVETAADIIEELPVGSLFPAAPDVPDVEQPGSSGQQLVSLGDDERRILDVIAAGPATLDQLLAGSGLNTQRLSMALAQLELSGLVSRAADGRYQGAFPLQP